MSTDDASGSASRPPQTKCANTAGDDSPDSAESGELPPVPDGLPHPDERVKDVIEELGDRAHQPVCETHGEKLRRECFEEEREQYEVTTEDGATVKRSEVTSRVAVDLKTAVRRMLEWQIGYHNSHLLMEYGREGDPSYDLMAVDLDNSWMVDYQNAERARLKALERQTCGYEACDKCVSRWCKHPDDHVTHWVSGEFDEPVVVLTGRTASGAGRAPVDHAREIADAWSDGGVRRKLRHVADSLGLDSDEWVRWTQGEPHTGKRAKPGYSGNLGLHHAHDIIILDASGLDPDGTVALDDGNVCAATFRGVIEHHVDKCAGAGAEAHDLDVEDWVSHEDDVGTVEVKRVEEEIEESVASYAASYLANESLDLLERSAPYLAWAATMWASSTRKSSGTDSRTHAIDADRCHHKHECGDQEIAHGEQVRRSGCRCEKQAWGPGCARCDGRGYHVVCSMCGSPWAIDQSQTLASARMSADTVAADGAESSSLEEKSRELWQDSRGFVSVGGPTRERECDHDEPDTCPLCATETESPDHTVDGSVPIPEDAEAPPPEEEPTKVSWVRPPKWRVKAVVVDGEEKSPSGGGVDKEPLKLQNSPEMMASMSLRSGSRLKCMDCGSAFMQSPKEYLDHGSCARSGHVGVSWLPTTEPPADEGVLEADVYLDAVPDRFLLDHGDRSDQEDTADASDDMRFTETVARKIRRIGNCDDVTSAEIVGRFCLDPDLLGAVEALLSAD